MSEQKQNLSAYLDDNLDHDEQRAMQLDGLGDTAHHYRLIGEAMRGQVSELSLMDVSRQVREAIAHEQPERPVSVHNTTEQHRPGLLDGLIRFGDWLRPVGGLAVAASVAMVVVVALQQQADPQTGSQPQRIAVQDAPVERAALARLPDPGSIVPVSNDPDLSRYLQQHSEFAARDTAQGRMPYVRAVGYRSQ